MSVCLLNWKHDGECRATIGRGHDVDFTVVEVDDGMNERQAESAAGCSA